MIKLLKFTLFGLLFPLGLAAQNVELDFLLKGKEYEQIELKAERYNGTRFDTKGENIDGCWRFSIPANIYESITGFCLIPKDYNKEPITNHKIVFGSVVLNDTMTVSSFFPMEKKKIIGGNYIRRAEINKVLGEDEKQEPVIMTEVEDIFLIPYSEIEGDELEIRMLFPRFGRVIPEMGESLCYTDVLPQYIQIAKRYPDSKFLAANLIKGGDIRFYNSKEDVKKIYDCFSEENKNSYFGSKIGQYLSYFRFENISLPTTKDTTIVEPILANSRKYNLIVFSASWCVPCHKLIPKLKEIHNDLSDNLDIVYLSQDEPKTKDSWVKLMKKESIPWRSLFIGDNRPYMRERYGLKGVPYTLLVHPDGRAETLEIGNKKDSAKLYEIVKQ
ncbi:thiol-disulfide isomerase/thioredoxin [Dysgonomonas sp. PH5-45]|uniref:TlpA family protein disulfide reductase n=1 Tax=unclassified Dysgonomonas TaxID=2630389 RepID=UPI0024737CFD|nr:MULTISPECIES: TlpA disulfide reductase family protein [unclassified Dysgonomonas]MDH6353766.1 thiol-disulfide isomerase/thioredoxin [Dysgonomonas sp. PH5-45]MDH6386669.1 thiol-disulfide isomerase/thioredoxin [Dysgonomonas sp. PH5-37]